MMSGGAIDAYSKGSRNDGASSQGIRRGEDKFQPRNAKDDEKASQLEP